MVGVTLLPQCLLETGACFEAHAGFEHPILPYPSKCWNSRWEGTHPADCNFDATSGILKGSFAFADSKPRDELLQSDRIQIVKLTDLRGLGGRTSQLQVPD